MITIKTDVVLQVMELCLDLKMAGHDAFCRFNSHVYELEVQIFHKGWSRDAEPSKTFKGYVPYQYEMIHLLEDLNKYVNDLNLLGEKDETRKL